MLRWSWLTLVIGLWGCAPPDQVGQQVGQSLYDASVNTGHALAVAGDRTGAAIQNAGANLRNAVSPPPTYYALPPPDLPPPYVPEGYSTTPPIGAEPLPPPLGDGAQGTGPNPALGY